ncbi:hypothetical protein D0436_18955 [Shewanella decolorationis]|uniref:Uncharacterized protein n=1 Tax=Shewanella decolorationis TaxID=256839 RepID=A0A5B8R2H9_9GAMM|nr:hypothetical protein [Shewanella decolorationis]QDZ92366.1 hypothetical protein D0436_18955 [Shewanella decolorationis]
MRNRINRDSCLSHISSSGGREDYYDYIDLNEIRRKSPESVDKFADMIDKTRELAIEVGDAAVKFEKFS